MDKPRICQVLGVEVGEHFSYNERPDIDIWFYGTGAWGCSKQDKGIDIPFYIIACINRPDRIIRKPRWTQQEVELAKVLYDLRRSESIVIGRNKGGALWWRDGDSAEGILPNKLFPSLSECNCFKLDEIIGGAE